MTYQPIPVFIYYLHQLDKLLWKIEQFEQGDSDILHARLSVDMLPLINQVRTTANFALRACCPLYGQDPVTFENKTDSFAGLHQQIARTLEHLTLLNASSSLPQIGLPIQDKAGFNPLNLPAEEFLTCYAQPNFFFHLGMVYAIARQQGVPLSKGDFDGYHHYPDGFSFENANH